MKIESTGRSLHLNNEQQDENGKKRRSQDKPASSQGKGGFDLPPADLILGNAANLRKKQEQNDPYRQFSSPNSNQNISQEPEPSSVPPATASPRDPFLKFSNQSEQKPEPGAWPKDATIEQAPQQVPQAPQQAPPAPPQSPPGFPQAPPAPPQAPPGFPQTPPAPPQAAAPQAPPPAPQAPPGFPQTPPAPPQAAMPEAPPPPPQALPGFPQAPPTPPQSTPQAPPQPAAGIPSIGQGLDGVPDPFGSAKAATPLANQNQAPPNTSFGGPSSPFASKQAESTPPQANTPTANEIPNAPIKSADISDHKQDLQDKAQATIQNPFLKTKQNTEPAADIPKPTFKRVQSRKSQTNLPAQPPTASSSPEAQNSSIPESPLDKQKPAPPLPTPQTVPSKTNEGPPPMPQPKQASGPPPMPQPSQGKAPGAPPPLPQPAQPSVENQPANNTSTEAGPSAPFNFEWSSTGTSNDVSLDKTEPEPAVQADSKERSLEDTNKAPDQSFPMYSSTDWEKPSEAMQLSADSSQESNNQNAPSPSIPNKPLPPKAPPEEEKEVIKLTVHSDPKEKESSTAPFKPIASPPKEKPVTPQNNPPTPTPPQSSPSSSSPPSNLPKMKKFAQKSNRPPSAPSAGEKKPVDNQFTKIDSSKPASNPPPAKSSKPVDPRLIAKQSAPEEPPKEPIKEPEEQANKLFNIEGKEISEPRELTKPQLAQLDSPEEKSTENNIHDFGKPMSDPQPDHIDEPKPSVTDSPAVELKAESNLAAEPEQINAQVLQANAHIRTAESALSNDNYSVAVPLLNKALMLITESGALDSPSALSCHQKLGECSYQKQDFEEACEHYEKCKTIIQALGDVEHETIVLIQQKLAKALEKSRRYSEAKTASQLSIDLAQDLLEPSHPLVNVAYRMHISLLKKTNATAQEIEATEQELRNLEDNSSPSAEVSEEINNHVNYITGSFNLENIEKQRQMRDVRKRISSSRFPSETKKSKVVPIVITVVILCFAGLAVGAYFLLNPSSSESPPKEAPKAEETVKASNKPISKSMQAYAGKTYKSADGLRSFLIKEDGTVEFIAGNQSKLLNWKEGDPGKNMVSDISNMLGNKATYTLHETENGFKGTDGTMYYSESAKDLSIINEMNHIADLAKYYFSKKGHKYPKDRSSFESLGADITLKNPLGTGMKPVVRLRYFNNDEGEIARDSNISQMQAGDPLFPPDSQGKAYPGLIECMSLRSFDKAEGIDGISFIIRAYGQNGKFITSSKADTVYVIAQENGVPIKVLKPDDIKLPFEKKKSTIVHFVINKK